MAIFTHFLAFVGGVAACLATAIFFPKPWLQLLRETSEEVKKTP